MVRSLHSLWIQEVVTGYQLLIGGAVLIGLGYGFNIGSISGFTIKKSTSLLIYLALLSSIAFSLWTILFKV